MGTTMTDRPATPCLMDNSALARLSTGEIAFEEVEPFTLDGRYLVTCTAQMIEASFSTRSAAEWRSEYSRTWSLLDVLHPDAETHGVALTIQRRLWESGRVRAAGTVDVLIAAIAMQHGAIVVHRDGDYEQIAAVAPEFRQVRL